LQRCEAIQSSRFILQLRISRALEVVAISSFSLNARPSEKPPRYLALGASFLNGSTVPGHEIDGEPASETQRVNTFAEFRNRAPEAIIGDSIYVYRIHD